MKALVTGASGFMGAHLSKRLLAKGYEVISILHDQKVTLTSKLLGIDDKITWCKGDILDENFVKRVIADYEVDEIYHLAALPIVRVGHRTVTPIYQINVFGTLNLMEALREQFNSGYHIKTLFMSTDKVYGNAGSQPYKEDMPLRGTSAYECSKACADMIVRSYYDNWGIPVVVARPSNIYGSADLNSRLIPNTIKRCLSGQKPLIYNNITYVREFTHIDDLCDALVLIMENMDKVKGQALNIGSGILLDQETLINKILGLFPGLTSEFVDPPPYTRTEIPYQKLDSTKILNLLGWKAKRNIDQELKEIVDWWKTAIHDKKVSI